MLGAGLTLGGEVNGTVALQGRRAVETLLSDNKTEAGRLLAQNRHIAESLRAALVARHELIGEQIPDVIREAQATQPGEAVEIIDLREVSSQ